MRTIAFAAGSSAGGGVGDVGDVGDVGNVGNVGNVDRGAGAGACPAVAGATFISGGGTFQCGNTSTAAVTTAPTPSSAIQLRPVRRFPTTVAPDWARSPGSSSTASICPMGLVAALPGADGEVGPASEGAGL